ncbi:hypothetical protein CR513_52319, partial [Mucuna pruriens]
MKAATKRIERPAQETVSIQAFWRQPFKLVVKSFDDTQDPHAYLQAFQTQMNISRGNDSLSCKLFLGTLKGVAMHWLANLPARTIRSFIDLVILQTKGESLKSYLARFNNATVQVNDQDQKFFVKAFQKGLRASQFSDALALRRPTNMGEIRA